jgi:hypothetical protein
LGVHVQIIIMMSAVKSLLVVIIAILISTTVGFLPHLPVRHISPSISDALSRFILKESGGNNEESMPPSKLSLEEKMKNWEATEEEQKAASLGGVVPGRSDAFDIGLFVLFPLMVLSGLAFAFFPLIMDKIDVDSVGPPPMV